jgi:hypothetical protein
MYFVGNVLSPTLTQPEQYDKTFAFTAEETQNLDLHGVPIRMEHHDQMEVGSVCSSWTGTDGSKWIMGKLNQDGFESIFAKHAINGEQPYYTGLSLQHTHTQYASGRTHKEAVEVSLCTDPRRSDCRIIFVSKLPSEKPHYKTAHSASKMVAQDPIAESTPISNTTEDTVLEPTTDPNLPTNVPPTELIELIVAQEKQIVEQNSKISSFQKEADSRRKVLESKNKAMAAALVENWSKTLDPADFTENSRHNILELAAQYPEETQALFRVAHHASQKHASEAKLKTKTVENKQASELQNSFNKVMSKQVHAASAKANTTNRHFMDALNKYRVAGKGRDLMEQVLETQQPKRRRMY